MDLGLARAERAIMVAKEAASQIGVIMMTQRMKIMIILQSKICMHMFVMETLNIPPSMWLLPSCSSTLKHGLLKPIVIMMRLL